MHLPSFRRSRQLACLLARSTRLCLTPAIGTRSGFISDMVLLTGQIELLRRVEKTTTNVCKVFPLTRGDFAADHNSICSLGLLSVLSVPACFLKKHCGTCPSDKNRLWRLDVHTKGVCKVKRLTSALAKVFANLLALTACADTVFH